VVSFEKSCRKNQSSQNSSHHLCETTIRLFERTNQFFPKISTKFEKTTKVFSKKNIFLLQFWCSFCREVQVAPQSGASCTKTAPSNQNCTKTAPKMHHNCTIFTSCFSESPGCFSVIVV